MVRTPSPEKITKILVGFLSNTGPDPLKNHKATKPAFNVGSLSARERVTLAIWIVFPLIKKTTKKNNNKKQKHKKPTKKRCHNKELMSE